jgi:hypothetical protein
VSGFDGQTIYPLASLNDTIPQLLTANQQITNLVNHRQQQQQQKQKQQQQQHHHHARSGQSTS